MRGEQILKRQSGNPAMERIKIWKLDGKSVNHGREKEREGGYNVSQAFIILREPTTTARYDDDDDDDTVMVVKMMM